MLRLGGHLSLGKDPRKTVALASETGYSCLQLFASSPGAWKPPVCDAEAVRNFVAARREYSLDPLFVHAIYLVNLASADPLLVKRSVGSLVATIRSASEMRAAGVVTHIGSHGGRGFEEVAGQIAGLLVEVLEKTPEDVDLILENSAGAGGLIGANLSEIGALIEAAGRPSRLRVAVDTAHLFAAGWDFTQSDVAPTLVAEIDRAIGLDKLALVHANDSKAPCRSRRDRHANIGNGFIGVEGFRSLVAETALTAVPWVLETPITDDEHPDRDPRLDDISALQSLAVSSSESRPVEAELSA